ncbi:MAG: hypothetical protein ABI589_00010 [Burkholderiales bacterium]
MNIFVRLLAGLALLLGVSVFTAWAWDHSDALNSAAPTTAAVAEKSGD